MFNNGTDNYHPLVLVEGPTLIDQFAFEVTIADAGKVARVGLYAADARWQPIGVPLADSGDISLTGTGVKTYTPWRRCGYRKAVTSRSWRTTPQPWRSIARSRDSYPAV